ncbi:hypothetical protein ACOMHN_035404 [Nucella lapillus]
MTVRPFEGMSGILEVECSGEPLDFSVDILTMALFVHRSSQVLAFVNVNKNQCTTAQRFSACLIDQGAPSSRRTRLKTLVLDLGEGESRIYGCNMTVLHSGRTYAEGISWTVMGTRKR